MTGRLAPQILEHRVPESDLLLVPATACPAKLPRAAKLGLLAVQQFQLCRAGPNTLTGNGIADPLYSPAVRHKGEGGGRPPPSDHQKSIAGIAAAFSSFGSSATSASVVIRSEATDAASCSAVRTTFAGSITPALTRS